MSFLQFLIEVKKLIVSLVIQPNVYVIDGTNPPATMRLQLAKTIEEDGTLKVVWTKGLEKHLIDVNNVLASQVQILKEAGVPVLKVSGKKVDGELVIGYCVAGNVKEEDKTIEDVASEHLRARLGIVKEVIYTEV